MLERLCLLESINEMNDLWNELLKKYANYIEKRLLTIMTKVHYFSRAYLSGLKENDYEIITFTAPNEMIIDEKDWLILQLLAPNSRISIVDIASKVKLTPKTVIEKIKKLENNKIIVGYKTVFDLNKLGYQYFKIHLSLNNITSDKVQHLKNFLKRNPYVVYEDEVLGGDDIEIELQVENTQKLRAIVDEIKSGFSDMIKDSSVLEYYKEHKYLFLPSPIKFI